VLESFLLALIRLTGGRLAEVFFGVGYDGSAKVCTSDHPIVMYLDSVYPPVQAHIHVNMRIWSKGGHATTILNVTADRISRRMWIDVKSRGPSTLDPSGAPVTIQFTLQTLEKDGPLPFSVGDTIPFELHMSRDWIKKVGLHLEEEGN
jgi:hypothetical protein